MSRRKRMQTNTNVFDKPIKEAVQDQVVNTKNDLNVKTLFQIYDPETESEFYTYDKLDVDNTVLRANNVIQKKVLEEVVIKQSIQVYFSYTSDEVGEIRNIEFDLFKGVVVKVC